MGWAHGTNREGREIGYGVEATCDRDGCEKDIDRGIAYVCGGMHDGDDHGCGKYFCAKHLIMGVGLPAQLCADCVESFIKNNPEEYQAAMEEYEHRRQVARQKSGVA